MNTTSRLLLIAASLGGLSLSACSGSEASADRNDDGTIVSDGTVGAFSLHVGDCYNDDQSLGADAEVSSVGAVPCDAPHDNEIFALVTAGPVTGPYPGDDAIYDDNVGACETAFARYVGIDYADSFLGMGPLLVPSPQTWATGDREIVCGLFNIDGAKLTESVKGAGDSVGIDGLPTAESVVASDSAPSTEASADVVAFCAQVDALADDYVTVLADPASGDISALVAQSQALTTAASELLTAHPEESAAVTACLETLNAALS